MSTTTTTTLPTGLTTGTWAVDASHTEAALHRPPRRHLQGPRHRRGHRRAPSSSATTSRRTSVTATLDPSTVNTGDANRDGHLKSGDFFDVETFGQWTFVSTEVRAAGDELRHRRRPHHPRRDAAASSSRPSSTAPRSTRSATRAPASRPPSTISRKDFGLTWNAALEAGGVLVSRQGRHRARRLDHQGLTPRPSRHAATAGSAARHPAVVAWLSAPGARCAARSWNARICSSEATSTARRSTSAGTRSARGANVRMPTTPAATSRVAHVLRDGRRGRDDADASRPTR